MRCTSVLAAIVVLGLGCSSPKKSNALLKLDSGLQEFEYHHAETTGITELISVKGKEVAIEYAKNSDISLVSSLLNEFDGSEKRIVVVGNLSPVIKWTPKKLGYAKPEPYQEFQLLQWRIVPKDYEPKR